MDWNNTKYTIKQFNKATTELRKILSGMDLQKVKSRNGKKSSNWEITSVFDIDGTAPHLSARKTLDGGTIRAITISAYLQDDGGPPYAVVALRKYYYGEKGARNWHAAIPLVEISHL